MRFDLPQQSGEAGSVVLLLRCLASPASEEIPLRFVMTDGEPMVLAPREHPPRWARTLLESGAASWRIGDQTTTGTAQGVRDPATLADAVVRFRGEFGDAEVERWFPDSVLGFRLHPDGDEATRPFSPPEAYFDRLAPEYDHLVKGNPLDLHLREVSGAILARAFHPPDRVLEIGCGTGLETLPLARQGVRILATDISGAMLARLREKADAEGLAPMIETRQVGAGGLHALLDEGGAGAFNGGFSDFGALNCESDLESVPSVLHDLLRPGSPLVLGIWNRYCAAETVLSLAAGKPRRALARWVGPVAVGHSRYGIPVFARGPGEFLELFEPYFETLRITGLPVFLPPYDFGGALRTRRELFNLLRRIDARLADKFPFNRVGDHFLVELRRRP